MSEMILESFYNYLINIGMININSVNQLNKIFHEVISKNPNIDFQNAMSASLMFFLNHMTEEQQKYTSLNLIIKFLENNYLEKIKKLKNIFYIKSKISKLKLHNFFYKWKKKNEINKSSSTLNSNKKSNTLFKIYKDNSTHKINSKSNLIKNSSIPQEASWITKEKESLSHCTFNPNINKNKIRLNSQPNKNISVFERLYEYNQKYSAKKQLKQVEYENIKNSQLTFKPLKLSNNIFQKYIKNTPPYLKEGKKFIENKNSLQNKTEYVNNYNKENYNLNKSKKNQFLHCSNSCVDYNQITKLYYQYKKAKNQENNGFEKPFKQNINCLIRSDLNNISLDKDNFNENKFGHKNIYTKTQKEEITKRIVERLYGDYNNSNNEE